MGATASKIINFRAPAAKQALSDHAAEVSGMNRTEFILDVARERARGVGRLDAVPPRQGR
jgi:uncharacterized protein (DUF1778 family)